LVHDKEFRQVIQEKIITNRSILFDDIAPIRALEEFLLERMQMKAI
jgi:hypothetical protein